MNILFSAVLSIPPGKPGSISHRLHYILGLRDLGHDVYLVEETYPRSCVDDAGNEVPFLESANVRIFGDLMRRFDLEEHACLLYDGGRETFGLPFDRIVDIAREADLLINLSGHLSTGPVFDGPRCRLYLDEDPVYTQVWSAEYDVDLNFEHHDVFATCGLNIGTDRSPIPDCSIDWIHTLPPVCLPEEWSSPAPNADSYSTVASWDVFGDVSYRGEWYGSRREELVRFASLPSLAGAPIEMMVQALEASDGEMKSLLLDGGWRLQDSRSIPDLASYRAYIAASRGEVGIAKNAYVKGRSGWFSERSADYLAAGRPVIAQSTGFESTLPTGEGLLSFGTLAEAVEAIRAVESDVEAHSQAARGLAERYLSHRVVLPRLLDAVGAAAR